MKNSTEVRKHGCYYWKAIFFLVWKKITESLNSKFLILILLLLLWAQESKGLSLSDVLPLHNCSHTSRSYCHPLSLNIHYFSAGSGRSREGANLWGSEHKIFHNSKEKTENCCQKCKLLFCLEKKSFWVSKTPSYKMTPQLLISTFYILGLVLLHTSENPWQIYDYVSWIGGISYRMVSNGQLLCGVKGRLG